MKHLNIDSISAHLKSATIKALLGVCLLIPFWHTSTEAKSMGIGLNKFDLAMQYTGKASGGDGSDNYRKVTTAMAKKAIADAQDAQVTYMRIAITGFAPSAYNRPSDLSSWISDPQTYWSHMDDMMNDLDKANIQGIFTFFWNIHQFPAMVNETAHDLLTNPNSQSYRLAQRYMTQFIERYKGRKTILFYEISNELNNLADLDNVARCKTESANELCAPKANFTTDEMIEFTRNVAHTIHQLDTTHPISSGFSIPRPAAEHMRTAPEWLTGKTDFKSDSAAQFKKNLEDVNAHSDIISVHLYNNTNNVRFGQRNVTDLLTLTKQYADAIGKPLFVGEFGDTSFQANPDAYTIQMMDRITALNIPYSAMWVWELYQKNTYQPHATKNDAYSLEPGIANDLIGALRKTNNGINPQPSSKRDTTPPHVVITSPLECALLSGETPIYVSASDNSNTINRIEFYLDKQRVSTTNTYPYVIKLNPDQVSTGTHTLEVRAFDSTENMASDSSRIRVGSAHSTCLTQ
ncbi:Ig-like domain-containing protein [Ephemeroptericola cinctiostellae]|nr:Ig-like domain-containing protein [Ephemeroptericola cinctiostellae]